MMKIVMQDHKSNPPQPYLLDIFIPIYLFYLRNCDMKYKVFSLWGSVDEGTETTEYVVVTRGLVSVLLSAV